MKQEQETPDERVVRISKFLSLVLRHNPDKIGITLDAQGWVPVDDLLEKARDAGKRLDRATLEHVVAHNDKKRFAFSDDGAKIRASQGHSVEIDLALPDVEPPALLYHGTASRFLESIRAEGLRPGARHDVHLSADIATARTVGARHGRPVVLQVDAAGMHRDGFTFRRSENGVWLTARVAARYLTEVVAP